MGGSEVYFFSPGIQRRGRSLIHKPRSHVVHSAHHWSWVVRIGAVKGLDVLELKHVTLHKGFADLLIGPGDE